MCVVVVKPQPTTPAEHLRSAETGTAAAENSLRSAWLARTFDIALIALLLGATFLLCCYQLSDGDVWWHLAGGRWILENGHVPGKDPFSFGSANREWVDVHWLFQVLLASLYARAGVAGVILLGAALFTAAVATAVWGRGRSWPVALTALLWVPVLLLMSGRFVPRPEAFSTLYLAIFLAVLWRAAEHPRLLWLLPVVQLFWVNMHGLFVLGPVVLCFYLVGKGVEWAHGRWQGVLLTLEQRTAWKRLGICSGLVLLACLANPYFLDGALFPLLLVSKVTGPSNIYKEYIAEFHSLRDFVQKAPHNLGLAHPYTRSFFFLLLMLPVSFVLPAAWDLWQRILPRQERTAGEGRTGSWVGALAAAIVLSALVMTALPGWFTDRWLGRVQGFLPAGFVLLGAIGGWALGRHAPTAAALAVLGGVFEAAWAVWLRGYLVDPVRPNLPFSLLIAAIAGIAPAVWIGSRPGGLFRLLLVGAFTNLALNAFRNLSLLGLVGGVVLVWNLGEWIALLVGSAAARPARAAAVGWSLRLAAAMLLGVWIVALATDRFYPWVGEARHFGLGQRPFRFAHEAAEFAGRPGMPEHSLAYDIIQASVYVFHNGPRRKTFLDPRLEVPTQATFTRYVETEHHLQQQDSHWPADLHKLGDPLVLLSHVFTRNIGAEAALLADPGWRCVYYDAMASVFIPEKAASAAGATEVDFAGRLLQASAYPVIPDYPEAASREAVALYQLAVALPSETAQSRRTAILLAALGRVGLALHNEPKSATPWAVLGDCHQMVLTASTPPSLTDPWDPSLIVPWAEATWCYEKARQRAPDDASVLVRLYHAFRERRMLDAELAVGERLRQVGGTSREQEAQIAEVSRLLAEVKRQSGAPEETPAAVLSLIRSYQPLAGVRLAQRMERRQAVTWSWPDADTLAMTYLQLGQPEKARHVWEHASATSEADRLCRLASTFWVERDFDAAIQRYTRALAMDPKRAEAWWALAMIHTQRGQADAALQACHKGLALQPSEQQRTSLQQLEELLRPYATAVPK